MLPIHRHRLLILREFVERTAFVTLCGQFEDAIDAKAFLKQNQADLLFVDIEMPGLSGLELVKSLPAKPMVIITTAFPEYALEGFVAKDVLKGRLSPFPGF